MDDPVGKLSIINYLAQKNKLLIKSYEPENNSNHTLF